ncbi:MAG: Peptidylprolyl isomerase [uncultured Thiotrichaceae bacterium]|uniref:Periplasmic chaperone PpiD n=1 Tax=uncultured Thiotrichaceae bacterium TaxID=298394 RepID=A0A6S6TZQ3_9GAMM|nr:MAG: Peptidylprolyl isomerase [uncultured Thiotrichaceae bacterium]
MLQAIHDKAKGWIAYAIVGFICIPFALWGINSYFEGGAAQPVATINGEEISSQDVQFQLSQIRRQYGRLASSLGEDQLKQMALDNVINQTLLRQKAEEEGYRASGPEVFENISRSFQTDGKFDREQYERFLQSQRRNQGEFENQVREDLTLRHFQSAVSSTAFVPKAQAEFYQSLRKQQRDVEHFTLKVSDFEGKAEVTDEQVAEYYEQNKARFMTEQRVKLAYIEINQDELAKDVEVTDEILQQYYDENSDRYLTPESRNTSHVLITTDSRTEEEAKQLAQSLYDAIQSGERTFEDVAQKDSDDKVAAENNGVVADVVMGDWGPLFQNAVFALEANQVSEPVKTEAGYELLRVNTITKAVQKSFAEVKSELEEDYRKTKAADLYLDKTDQVQTIAYEQSGDLAPAAQAAGLTVKSTDWVTRTKGEGIAENPKVLDAAFSEDVLGGGKNSEPLELSDTQAVVVRVTEQEAAKQKSLDDVKDEIVSTLKAEEARKLTAKKGEELLAALIAAGDWSVVDAEAATKSTGTEATEKLVTADEEAKASVIEKAGKIERVGSQLPPAVVGEAFALPRPEAGKSSWGSAVMANGDYVLVAVKSVEDGAVELDDNARQLVNSSVSNREVGALLKALRERAEIELAPENI